MTRLWLFLLLGTCQLATVALATPPAEVARELDRLFHEELFAPAQAELAPKTDDAAFLRRLTLDTIGRQPTPEEITRFVLDSDASKRAKIIERLLADPEYGENWARYWRDVILYRRSEQRALFAADPLEDYLKAKLNANVPWSEIATEFITALGNVQENGQTALIVAQEGRPEETVAEISRIFLGIQIQCAQCHDHPTDRWKREQFHQLVAFFPRVAARPEMGDPRNMVVTANDSPLVFRRGGMNNMRFRGTPEHFMPDLNDPDDKGQLMQPVFFLTGESLPVGTRDAERRSSLARWITAKDNPFFAKALINRLWSELVGEGFYEPVDDLGPDRVATAPQTLDYLTAQFVAADFDVKWLLTTIFSTETYQRESRPRRKPDVTPFVANVSQPLRADQLFTNLLAVLEFAEPERQGRRMYGGPRGALREPRFAFATVFGFDPSEHRVDVQGTIPQALALMNGPLINGALRASGSNWLGQMLAKTPGEEDAIVELYLKTLAREPSPQELATCREYVAEINNRPEAFEDLLWSLINSAEFLHRR